MRRDVPQQPNAQPAQGRKAAYRTAVVWNVFYDEKTGEGNVSDEVLQEQLRVVNNAFNPIGLSFQTFQVRRHAVSGSVLHGVVPGSQNEAYVKRTHVGNEQYLNIWLVGPNPDFASSWATYPWDYSARPGDDGVVLQNDTLPGGTRPHYDQGKTAVHQIGHWAGLWSTYHNGCAGFGDYVDDTPAEATPAVGCPTGRDTCQARGTDPIHNYMDDSYDDCRTHFTPGQYDRIRGVLSHYRDIDL
ncbi:zinc metalloprotease [Streptomyces sp. SID161]|uniref:M43 family zinc metalloprotease n=1 Tax=Streptomyces sp. SID161 TaxID=2690251 RepID=UPI00136CE732|nr:zinc metalloprotease [Streptomyces sp. SID161]